jgi:hypothetical protein
VILHKVVMLYDGCMLKHLLLSSIFLVACGDTAPGPDAGKTPEHGDLDLPVDPGSGDCVAIDWNQVCPDAPTAPTPDASLPDAQEPPPELDEETKGACCHALLDGTPPNHECGYPPGLCKNGKKELFCKLADGTDAQFILCNP